MAFGGFSITKQPVCQCRGDDGKKQQSASGTRMSFYDTNLPVAAYLPTIYN